MSEAIDDILDHHDDQELEEFQEAQASMPNPKQDKGFEGWVVFGPDGKPILNSIDKTKDYSLSRYANSYIFSEWSIKTLEKNMKTKGYRVTKVRITEVGE